MSKNLERCARGLFHHSCAPPFKLSRSAPVEPLLKGKQIAVATFFVVSSKPSLPIMLVAIMTLIYNQIITFYPR